MIVVAFKCRMGPSDFLARLKLQAKHKHNTTGDYRIMYQQRALNFLEAKSLLLVEAQTTSLLVVGLWGQRVYLL